MIIADLFLVQSDAGKLEVTLFNGSARVIWDKSVSGGRGVSIVAAVGKCFTLPSGHRGARAEVGRKAGVGILNRVLHFKSRKMNATSRRIFKLRGGTRPCVFVDKQRRRRETPDSGVSYVVKTDVFGMHTGFRTTLHF